MKNIRSKKRRMGFLSPLSLDFKRGTTLMSAKHDEGMLMSVDSLVFSTSKKTRSYDNPSKIQKIGTHDVKYMLYGGCGASLTTDLVFNGLQDLANKQHKEGTVLTAKEGIKLAKRMLDWSYRNFTKKIKLEDEKAYTTVMLASHESEGAEADGKEGKHVDEEDDVASFKFDGGSDEEGNDKNEEEIEDTDDEDMEDEDEEDDEEGRDGYIEDSEEEEREDDEDEGESGDEEERGDEVPKAELQSENEEEQKVGPRKLFLSMIRSDDKYKCSRKFYAHIVEDDEHEGESGDEEERGDEVPKAELQSENEEEQKVGPRELFLSMIRSDDKFRDEEERGDDVPVPPSVEFNPTEFFSSGDFQANSMAGLYGADHENWYPIPKLSVKGAGAKEGLKYLNDHLKKDSNLDAEALTVFQDAMVDACATGESGGTIRVYCIDKQNNIRDLASNTLSELQQAKASRFPRSLKRTLSELQQVKAGQFPSGHKRRCGT